jgi:bifunctional non-homologous end joining protein LigD
MPLETYRRKRDFAKTPEPAPGKVGEDGGRFVVGRHRATRLHYDLRLEIGGVLVSWAVPRGPTLDPEARRLAQRTEDHPVEYLEFEGVIPRGEYGAGDAIVWDWGTFEAETGDPAGDLAAGELKFRLHGEKLRGRFTIIRTGGRRGLDGRARDEDRWLLLHKRDEAAVPGWDPEQHRRSVRSGRTNEEVAAGVPPRFEARPPEPLRAPDLSAARATPLPGFIPPMLATPVDAGFSSPDWLYEVKWDGYRVEAVIRDGQARLWTRNRRDAGTYFPDLAGPAPWLAADSAVVDGEVVALDEEGKPSFSLLQERTGLRGLEVASGRRRPGAGRRSSEERAAIPLAYCLFDLLYVDGRSLLAVPLVERKALLRRLLRPHPVVRFAGHVEADGEAFLEAARTQGLEGMVAKRRLSVYEPGRRSKAWLKVKLRAEQEVVVIGWLEGQGSHRDLGSLVVAVGEEGRLRHAGQVGSGIDARRRKELLGALRSLERRGSPVADVPPLKGVHWAEPRIVVRTEFAEWTADGLLRQATFRGLEPDREPGEVVRETASPVRRVLASGHRPPPREGPISLRRGGEGAQAGPEPGASADHEGWSASAAELAALDEAADGAIWTVGGRQVRLTNLDKVIVEGDAGRGIGPVTKRDLVRHYCSVAPLLIPYLADRGTTVQRFPDGTARAGFWQKDLPGHAPAWVRRWTFRHRREGPKDYPVVDHVATLAWLAQEAAVELHPWTSPAASPEEPSYALVDIDPGTETTWDEVVALARLYRAALEHLSVIGVPKVTGKRGIQVWIPVRPGCAFDDTRDWVERLSRAVAGTVPDLVSWEWAKAARRGRARLDFTQNAVNRTLVAPYSVRPLPGGPVSAPIRWEELDDPQLAPDRWTVANLATRVEEVGDLFAPALERSQVLPSL